MMLVHILLLNFLQWAFVITLPKNYQKTNCDEKKVSCNSLDSHLLQLTIGIYDKILKCQGANMILKCRHKMSNSEKKVYDFLKKGIFIFSCIYDPVYSRDANQIVTKEQEAIKCLEKTK